MTLNDGLDVGTSHKILMKQLVKIGQWSRLLGEGEIEVWPNRVVGTSFFFWGGGGTVC